MIETIVMCNLCKKQIKHNPGFIYQGVEFRSMAYNGFTNSISFEEKTLCKNCLKGPTEFKFEDYKVKIITDSNKHKKKKKDFTKWIVIKPVDFKRARNHHIRYERYLNKQDRNRWPMNKISMAMKSIFG